MHAKSFQSCLTLCDSLPCPPPGHLPDPGIKPLSLMSPVLAGGSIVAWAKLLIVKKMLAWYDEKSSKFTAIAATRS